jgi:hypothetical protein
MKEIIEMLQTARINQSELIDIAKGKYKLPMNIKEKTKHSKFKRNGN